jgi:hypothetical protein
MKQLIDRGAMIRQEVEKQQRRASDKKLLIARILIVLFATMTICLTIIGFCVGITK